MNLIARLQAYTNAYYRANSTLQSAKVVRSVKAFKCTQKGQEVS